MPTKTKINVRLLRRIQKQIAKEPRQFDMSTWFAMYEKVPNCGTTACIAGWALACSAKLNPLQAAKSIRKSFGRNLKQIASPQSQDVSPKASRLLGLTSDQADRLFHVMNWPEAFASDFACKTKKKQARIAIARIEHFIKTGGADVHNQWDQ